MTDVSERMNSRIRDGMKVDAGGHRQPKKTRKTVIMAANTQTPKQPFVIPRSGTGILSISKALFGSGRPSSSSRHRSGKNARSRTTKNRHQVQNPKTTTMMRQQRETIPNSTIDKELQWISREHEGPRDVLKDILSSSKATQAGGDNSSSRVKESAITTTTTTKVLSKQHKKKKKRTHKRSSSYNRERFHPQLTFIEESSESEEDDHEDQQSRDGSESSGSEASASSDESIYIEDDLSSNATTITNTSGSSGSRSSGYSSSKQAIVNGVYNLKQYRHVPEDSTDDDDIYIENDDSSSNTNTTTSTSSGSSSGCSNKSPICRAPDMQKCGYKNLDLTNNAHSDQDEMEIEYFSASEEEQVDSSDDDDDDDDTLSSRSTTSTSSQRSTSSSGSSGSISSDECLELVDESSQNINVSQEDVIQRQAGLCRCCRNRNKSETTSTGDSEPTVHRESQHGTVASQDSQYPLSVWNIVYLILSIVMLTVMSIVKMAACPVKAQLLAIRDKPQKNSSKKGSKSKKRTSHRTGRQATSKKEIVNTVDTVPFTADWESILASSSTSLSPK